MSFPAASSALPAGTTDVVLRELFPAAAPTVTPTEFLVDHVEIEDPEGNVIPFELWDCQRDTLTALHQDGAIIVLKARRLGLSWVVLAYALWLAIFRQGIRILILCKREEDSTELLDRIRRMRDRIAANPASQQLLVGLRRPARIRDAVTTLDVGASTIRALVGTEGAARSETAGLLILDEFAFQRGAGGIWRAALPTVEGGGKLAVVSTGNGGPNSLGLGAEFARQWHKAVTGKSPLKPLFFPWQARPGRDEAWWSNQVALLGEERARTEYPSTPDDAFVQPDTILAFSTAAIDAAENMGRMFDELLAQGRMPPPANGMLAAGVDWGDFRSHALPVWELERGGLYIPPGEVSSTQTDVEDITIEILNSVGRLPGWFGEERYDSSFKQSNRTFARTAQAKLGPHNPIRRIGRPNTVPVAFGEYKSLVVGYLRFLLRRTLDGEKTRILAISPKNTTLLEQMRSIEQLEDGRLVKGNDDAVDALIAGAQPVAKRHRALVDDLDRAAA